MGLYAPKTWTNGVDVLDKTNLEHLETQYDLAITIVRKTADQTVNNSTVLVNDTHLLLPIAANEEWVFHLTLYIKNADGSGTPDFKFQFTVPALASIEYVYVGLNAAAAMAHQYSPNWAGVAAVLTVDVANAIRVITIDGLVQAGANAGNVQLQWAQNVANASDTNLKAGSCLIAHQLD